MGTLSWIFSMRPVLTMPPCLSSAGLGTLSVALCGVEDKAIPGRGREPSGIPQRQASGEGHPGWPSWQPRLDTREVVRAAQSWILRPLSLPGGLALLLSCPDEDTKGAPTTEGPSIDGDPACHPLEHGL